MHATKKRIFVFKGFVIIGILTFTLG
jgi:hypothetical protein